MAGWMADARPYILLLGGLEKSVRNKVVGFFTSD
jgi:hypothetical protein